MSLISEAMIEQRNKKFIKIDGVIYNKQRMAYEMDKIEREEDALLAYNLAPKHDKHGNVISPKKMNARMVKNLTINKK